MNVSCPTCSTIYRIDPSRVAASGTRARCRECDAVFRVPGDATREPGVVTAGVAAESTARGGAPPAATAGGTTKPGAVRPRTPVFGPQDPQTRAKRLARALVSDIVVYNEEKWEESRDAGTLRKEFRDEILKSWEEYVEQVGEEMAKSTPYFRDALNAILAEGEQVF